MKLPTQRKNMQFIEKMKQMFSRHRGNIGALTTLGIGLAVFGVAVGIGGYVLTEVEGQMTGTATQITGNATEALTTAASWLNIYTIAAIALLIIGAFVTMLSIRKGGA